MPSIDEIADRPELARERGKTGILYYSTVFEYGEWPSWLYGWVETQRWLKYCQWRVYLRNSGF